MFMNLRSTTDYLQVYSANKELDLSVRELPYSLFQPIA